MKNRLSILTNPIRVIEAILAGIIIVVAAVSLVHDIVLGEYSQTFGVRLTLTIIYALLSAPTIASFFVNKHKKIKHNLRLYGLLLIFVAFLFLATIRIFNAGWFPPIWVYTLGGSFIAMVCYICADMDDNNGD